MVRAAAGVKPPVTETSNDELLAQARDGHDQCLACMRQSIEHARRAGVALNTLKDRIPKGEWVAWVKSNFTPPSIETARVYMRIAKNWEQIESNGWHKGKTLDELRRELPKLLMPEPQAVEAVTVPLDKDDRPEFDRMVEALMEPLGTATVPDTICEAVKFCYQEKICA